MWRFKLPCDVTIQTSLRPDRTVSMWEKSREGHDVMWAVLSVDGELDIRKDYSTDGATPIFNVFGLLIGPPMGAPYHEPLIDGPCQSLYIPTLVHDVGCQFEKQLLDAGVDRVATDKEFYRLALHYKFPLAKLYYSLVRAFCEVKQWWGRL